VAERNLKPHFVQSILQETTAAPSVDIKSWFGPITVQSVWIDDFQLNISPKFQVNYLTQYISVQSNATLLLVWLSCALDIIGFSKSPKFLPLFQPDTCIVSGIILIAHSV
jgi:hypothetical protein